MVSAKRAVELDPEDPGAHCALAAVLLYERLWAESAKEFEISLRLNPNEADAWDWLADLKVMEGRGEEGWRQEQAAAGTVFVDTQSAPTPCAPA
jgi:uncharacterized protein HemY